MENKLSYEEIEKLVEAYQEGNEDAIEELYLSYEAYFQQFITVLTTGQYDIHDRTQRKFIAYFVPEGIKSNVKLFKKSPYIQQELHKTVSWIRSINLTELEWKHEIWILFAQLMKRHRGNSFPTYVTQSLPPQLSDLVKRLLKEKDYENKKRVSFQEDMVEGAYEDTYDFEKDEPPFYIQPSDITMYDENWINGYGCGDIFGELTSYERRLLKWYYEDKTFGLIETKDTEYHKNYREMNVDDYKQRRKNIQQNETDIAIRLGCSRKTVNIKRNEIKSVIEEIAREQHLIKG